MVCSETDNNQSISEKESAAEFKKLNNGSSRLKPVQFLESSEEIKATTYSEYLSQLSSESELMHKRLNDSLFDAFNFNSREKYNLALANGFPTQEELKYVYNHELNALVDEIHERLSKIEKFTDPDYVKIEKLASLTFNRALDELINLLKDYKPDYTVGDFISERKLVGTGVLPPELELAINTVDELHLLSQGNLALSYLVNARYTELIRDPNDSASKFELYTQLAVAGHKLSTVNIRRRYWPDNLGTEEYAGISVALRNIGKPIRQCN
ncbi:hypothetical protein [Agaribacter flavus]|uniref:Uncharacterized protein n=1 Tax=Agaribacter flavus TaxID=1902781 RepID=A0ABV7FQ81_9ALTE